MQAHSPTDDERGSIIDAAYACLSEPHTNPIPVAAILARARVSTRAFYRHFGSKDELFLAMLQRENEALAGRLSHILDRPASSPTDQLTEWLGQMFALAHDPQLRAQMRVIDSEEVRAARGYQQVRERTHTDRERSLRAILQRGRQDGSFPLADPEHDAVAISAVVSREITTPPPDDPQLQRVLFRVLDFALRALGAERIRGR